MESMIGVINYNISNFSNEELFKWCRDNSVGYVELQRKDVWEDIGKPENRIRETGLLLQKYGIKVSQISSGSDFLQKTGDDLNRQVWMVGEMCKMVKDLGFNQLRIDGGWPKKGVKEEDYRDLIMKGVSKVTENAEKENVYLALDNHGTVTNNHVLLLDILKTINSKHLGTNLDTMNYRWYGYAVDELRDIYRQVAPYTLHTHLKDGTGSMGTYKGKVLGEGEVPVVDAVNILKDAGYRGVWCVEYEGKDGAEGYKKSVAYLRKLKL